MIGKTRRVEWIGARSPMSDNRVIYRKIMGLYEPDMLAALENASKAMAPLVRVQGTTARLLSTKMGYSREYKFGSRKGTYIQEMSVDDAKHLFDERNPDRFEFRDLDNPEHDDREPIVPWAYVDRLVYAALKDAVAGPLVTVSSLGMFNSGNALVSEYERRFDVERAARLRADREQKV